MNKKEIKAYAQRCLAGQGNQVDLGNGLADVIVTLADLLPDPADIDVKHYLTFKTADANENTVKIIKNGSAPDLTLYYSRNAQDWFPWENYSKDMAFSAEKPLYLCGLNNAISLSSYYYNNFTFSNDNGVYCDGSIMSLLSYAEELTTISREQCFCQLFRGCTSLVQAPELLATTLAYSCYEEMFKGCTSLVQAPELPATTLASQCYLDMFRDCISLVQAPELPATTLASQCYADMFQGCASLVQAPELPATTLASQCYSNMFRDCTALNYAKCLATTSISGNTSSWLNNVSATGTFVKAQGVSWPSGASGIPSGWTVEEV